MYIILMLIINGLLKVRDTLKQIMYMKEKFQTIEILINVT